MNNISNILVFLDLNGNPIWLLSRVSMSDGGLDATPQDRRFLRDTNFFHFLGSFIHAVTRFPRGFENI
jgi:hypothetical protein